MKHVQRMALILVLLTTPSILFAQNKKPAPTRSVVYRKIGDVELRLHVFEPKGHKKTDKRPAIVFFFGGGWNGGTPSQFYPHCSYLASRGMVAMSAEYRVKSRNKTTPFDCVEDGKAAVRWIRKNADKLGVDPKKVAAGGGSAGGHVAAATATVPGLEGDDQDKTISSSPDALVLFNPVYDNGPKGYGYERVKDRYKEISPLHNINKGMAPAIVFLGTKDKLIPVETAKDFQARMRKVGSRSELMLFEGAAHGFFNFGRGDGSAYRKTVKAMDEFLTSLEYLKGEPTIGKEPQKMPLWGKQAPIAEGKFAKEQAWITVHRPEKANGTAIVICPGGGYGGLVTGAEGHGIAKWLNQNGITGVVLEYRLPRGRSHVPLWDAQRAIRTIRAHAKKWNLDPSRIGIMGFSAGGHLASTAGTHFDKGNSGSEDVIEQRSSRPDFMILVYPVITMSEQTHRGSRNNLLGKAPSADLMKLFSNEQQVTRETPPTFLAHAKDDKPVPPENSRAFHRALEGAKVPTEYLELPSGGHGLNGYKGPMWDAWQNRSLEWLREQKFAP